MCYISTAYISYLGISGPVARTWKTASGCSVNWLSPEVSEARLDLIVQHDFSLSWNTNVLCVCVWGGEGGKGDREDIIT